MLFRIFLACNQTEIESTPVDSAEQISDPTLQFSIAVIADPHIVGGGAHSERLQQTVNWINTEQDVRNIEIVVILGDVGWGDGLVESKVLLDGLTVPYVPVIGDNEVHFGDEENFGTVYGPQYNFLSTHFSDWNRNGAAVWNPEEEQNSWFYNFAFSHRGLRFITADWAARTSDSIFSEMGDLHDFDGGSWSFFQDEVLALDGQKENSTIFFSHTPMYLSPGGFDVAETEKIASLTSAYSDLIYAAFSGHYHINADAEFEEAGFDVFITDAVWDDVITIRMVEVWENEVSFSYQHEMIEFEYEEEGRR